MIEMKTNYTGSTKPEDDVETQLAVIKACIDEAAAQLVDAVGNDQQITSLAVEFSEDGVGFFNGSLWGISFSVELATRVR